MDEPDSKLYQRCGTDLLHLATMLVGPSDAEDVFAEAWLNATRAVRWSAFDDDTKRAYLYRTVLNQARQHHRSHSRRERRESLLAAREVASHLPQCPAPEVWKAVAGLEPRARAVVFLTFWADLDGKAVAALLDVSLRSVRRDLANARVALRRSLDVSSSPTS